MKKLVKKIPIKGITLEVSHDEKSAVMIFEDDKGEKYTLRYYRDQTGNYEPLSVQVLQN